MTSRAAPSTPTQPATGALLTRERIDVATGALAEHDAALHEALVADLAHGRCAAGAVLPECLDCSAELLHCHGTWIVHAHGLDPGECTQAGCVVTAVGHALLVWCDDESVACGCAPG